MIFRIAALGIGALAMYYFDPVSGKRRRDSLRGTLSHARHEASNRTHGLVAEARSAIERRGAHREQPDRRDPQQRWPVDPIDIDRS